MSEESASAIPKWQIGLAVGVPIAVLCAGAFLYYRWNRKAPQPSSTNSRPTTRRDGDQENEKPTVVNEETENDSHGATERKEAEGNDEKEYSRNSDEESQPYKSPTVRARESKDKGNKFFRDGHYLKAIECYTHSIQLAPRTERSDLAVYHHNRGACYEKLGAKAAAEEKQRLLKEAQADCTEALKCNPKYVKALVRRAKVAEVFEDYELAIRDLTAACLVETFGNVVTMESADRVLKELGKRKAKESFKNRKKELPSVMYIDQYLDSFSSYRLVDQVLEDGEIGASPSQTDESSDPGLADYTDVLQSIQKHNYDNVLEKCSHAIEKGLTATLPNALVLRGTFSLLKMESDDAIRDFTQVLSMGDDKVSSKLRVHTLLKRSSAYQVEDKETEATADFVRALELDEHDADVFHHRGQLRVAENKLEAAIDDFTTAISLNGSFVHPHIQLGFAQYKLGIMEQSQEMLEKADNTFQQTVKQFPDSGEAHNIYAQMQLDRQNIEKATEMFEKALELSPGNATPWVHKGLMAIQFGQDIDGGISLIEQALKVDPKCEFAYETLAAFEMQKGNTDHAIELFQKAMSLVRSESELAQAYSLCDAAVIQQNVARELGIMPPLQGGQHPMFPMM